MSGSNRHIRATAVLGALVLLAVGVLTSRPAGAAFSDTDGDGAIDAVEEALGSDPASAGSTPESLIYPFFSFSSCFDAVDNDSDGNADAADGGCIDSDGSGWDDETELRLGSDPNNDESEPEDSRLAILYSSLGYFYPLCGDESDNDGDGLTDAADPGCAFLDSDADGFDDTVEKGLGSDWEDAASRPEHIQINAGSCGDGLDNDGDSFVDGADDGCIVAENDDFADAIVVDTLPFTHNAKVADLTGETGEEVSSCGSEDGPRETVWYKYTAPADARVLIDASGTDLLIAVSVWREGTFGLTEVECSMGFPVLLTTGRFAVTVSGGETYFIQVERYVPSEPDPSLLDLGRLSFHMEAVTPPANDSFAAAQPIDALPFTASLDTVAADVEPGEPDASCRFQGQPASSVWYRLTPASDAYVLVDAIGSTNFSTTIGAYEGSSLGTLDQVACGPPLAFHALAGHTYYLQAAGYRCQPPGGFDGGISSFCIDSRSGLLEFHVETFVMPACSPPQFSFPDPTGDSEESAFESGTVDVTALSLSFTETTLCLTLDVDGPIEQDRVWARAHVDADLDRNTGDQLGYWNECAPPGIGADVRVFTQGADGLLADGVSSGLERGFVTYSPSSFTMRLPISALGGDTSMRLAVETLYGGSSSASFSDCAPNGGHISCENGVCEYVPFRNGDANCADGATSIDAAIILQYGAGLVTSISCPDGADVNGDGVIDSRDAALVLQFVAGLVERLPPPVCSFPPECPLG